MGSMFDGKALAAEVIGKVRDHVLQSEHNLRTEFNSRVDAESSAVRAAIDGEFSAMADVFVKGLEECQTK